MAAKAKFMTVKESNILYRLMKKTHDILTKHKITYFLTGGSLLGAVRHSGVIPWDDDGDIVVFLHDVPKLKKLQKVFDRAGLELVQGDESDYKCDETQYADTCSWIVAQKGKHFPTVDVFVMKVDGERVQFANPVWKRADNGGKKCYHHTSTVFPLVPRLFGNFYMYTPNDAMSYLNNCYGVTWNSQSMQLYNHKLGKWIDSGPHLMKYAEYYALKAPKDTHDEEAPVVKKTLPKRYTTRA